MSAEKAGTVGIPFFGIWNEAWETCLRAHNIDITDRERERITEAVKGSYYHPDQIELRAAKARLQRERDDELTALANPGESITRIKLK